MHSKKKMFKNEPFEVCYIEIATVGEPYGSFLNLFKKVLIGTFP